MVAMGIGRFAYTPILPLMQNDLSFSNAIAGYLATSNYAGYLVGAVLAGIFSFKNKKTLFLRLSLIISVMTTLMMGFSHSFVFMLIIRFLSGVVSAFIFVLASSIVLDKLARENKANWSGIFYSGVGLGIFLSGIATPSLNQAFHWEGAWIGLAIISGILTLFIWIFLKDSPQISAKQTSQNRVQKLPPAKWLPWLIAAYGLEGFGYIITGTFIVAIADQTLPLTTDPTSIWVVVGLTAAPSCMLWALLSKKLGYVKSLIVALFSQAVGIVLPVIWMSYASLIMSAILFGATFMGIATLTTTLAKLIQPENSSRTIGLLTAVYAVGQMIGPIFAGTLATNTNNFNIALIGAASTVMLGGLILFTGIRYE